MPIHDQSYRRYGGQRERPGSAWSVIAWSGIRTLITQRRFLLLLIVAWLPFIVRAVQIYLAYLAANFPQADILRPSPETFRGFLDQQGIFLLFVTVYVGAGLVANDRVIQFVAGHIFYVLGPAGVIAYRINAEAYDFTIAFFKLAFQARHVPKFC